MNQIAKIIPAEEFARRREEREQQRQQKEALAGSILGLLDDEDKPSAPALPAERRDPIR